MSRCHRWEARAFIESDRTELLVDCSELQLVTVALTDAGALTGPDGGEHTPPDVVCHLRPDEARELAGELLCLADRADRAKRPANRDRR